MDEIICDAKLKFNSHKSQAKRRGIEFNFTFEEWWGMWKPHFHNRGTRRGQFVMCRTMDRGAYEIGNVRIDTVKGNAHTRAVVSYEKKIKAAQEYNKHSSEDDREDDEDGWMPRELKNPFRSSCNSW